MSIFLEVFAAMPAVGRRACYPAEIGGSVRPLFRSRGQMPYCRNKRIAVGHRARGFFLATAVGIAVVSIGASAAAAAGKGGSSGSSGSGAGITGGSGSSGRSGISGGSGSSSFSGGGSGGSGTSAAISSGGGGSSSGGSSSTSGGNGSSPGGSNSTSGGSGSTPGGSNSTSGSTPGGSGNIIDGSNSTSGGSGSTPGGSGGDVFDVGSLKSLGLTSDSITLHGNGGVRLTTGDDGINLVNGGGTNMMTLGANVWSHGGGMSVAFPLGQSDGGRDRGDRNGFGVTLPKGTNEGHDSGNGIRTSITDILARPPAEPSRGPWTSIVDPAETAAKLSKPVSKASQHSAGPSTSAPRNAPGSSRPNFDPAMFGSGAPPPGETRFIRNEVLVGLPTGMSARDLAELARTHRLDHVGKQYVALTGTTLHAWRFDENGGRSIGDVIRDLEADKRVSSAQPNYLFKMNDGFKLARVADKEATDADIEKQYSVAKLHLLEAHEVATGKDVLIAVIDSGIDTRHPEIDGAIAGTFDAVNSRAGPDAHGTATAGMLVAHDRLKGVAPGARILAARAFVSTPEGIEATSLSIVRSLNWAIERGAQIINMSFAGPVDPEVARALAAARQRGVILVAAAGNAGRKSAPLYPAADPNVIAVTATDAGDHLMWEANRGQHIFAAAPGVDILVPSPGGGYHLARGTSLSAPQVAGVVALLLSIKPDLTQDGVKDILAASAHDLGPKGRDDKFGVGLIDAYQAVDALANAPSGGDRVAAVGR